MISPLIAAGAGYQTTNFVVSAPTPDLAKEIGDIAEYWRREMAAQWLGQEMPTWASKCPISARVSEQMGAGGATSFVFDRGEVFDWKMNIQGSRRDILESVLPHEITHTVFASYFRQPLPRWADEGACTTVEHHREIVKQERMLYQHLRMGRGIQFSRMMAMQDYPADVLPVYAQGQSVVRWLISINGRKVFLAFLEDGMKDKDWQRAVHANYGFRTLHEMQDAWLNWRRSETPQ